MSKPIKIIVISSICLVVTLAIVLGCVFGIKCTVTFYSGISFVFPSAPNPDNAPTGGLYLNTLASKEAKVIRFSTFSPDIPTAIAATGEYTFLGWYKDSALTVPWLSTDKVTSNITLYAKWLHLN